MNVRWFLYPNNLINLRAMGLLEYVEGLIIEIRNPKVHYLLFSMFSTCVLIEHVCAKVLKFMQSWMIFVSGGFYQCSSLDFAITVQKGPTSTCSRVIVLSGDWWRVSMVSRNIFSPGTRGTGERI